MNNKSYLFNISLFIICLLLVFLTATLGGYFTNIGIASGWYSGLNLPSWTPAGSIIGMIWTFLYLLLIIAIFILLLDKDKKYFNIVLMAFLLNLFLNILWSYLFFTFNLLLISFLEALLLALSVLLLIYLAWPKNRIVVLLLSPYFVWVLFAAYLNLQVWLLN